MPGDVHFIADLHLHPQRQALKQHFLNYLAGPARAASQLCILGDLFEMWVADDVSMADYPDEIAALKRLSEQGTAIAFMHGNRDFLCGAAFARAAGMDLWPDPSRVELPDGVTTLLMHGDILCTDDRGYQRYRRVVRNPLVQWLYFRLPRSLRLRIASQVRGKGQQLTSSKPDMIMDVNESAVGQAFREHRVRRIIHGHTHRPADHCSDDDRWRIVLADWSDAGGEYLSVNASGAQRHRLA